MTAPQRGQAEYAALVAAMEDDSPACSDDARFISDELTDLDRFRMRGLCRTCPLLDACTTYASVAKPTGGYWAGKHHGAARKPKGGDER